MKAMKIGHIGIAVNKIDEVLPFYREGLGLTEIHFEEVPSQKVRVAVCPLGESRLELVEATSPDSPIAAFLAKRGPGIHHIALEVEKIEPMIEQLKAKGYRLIDEVPRIGAEGKKIAFIHPQSSSGVLIELSQTR